MLRRIRHDEQGVAIVTVMLVMVVVLGLVAATMSYATGSLSNSRRDQDWNAALAAAEAGVDDYVFRLNQDGNYWVYTKTNNPPDGNLAFKQFVPVPGPTNEATFSYAADTSTIASDGTIKLKVVGKVRKVKRTVQVTLRRRNFLDYLYFTDYETKDPALYVKPPDPYTAAEAQIECAKHYYEARPDACIKIFFITRDTINGPMHSNDAIQISGNPTFNGPTSTSWNDPANKRWLGTGSPVFAQAGDPKFVSPLTLPPSNTSIKTRALPGPAPIGCLYTGPTEILVKSTGRMDVKSPLTKSTNAGCGPGTNLNLPGNGVIYVQSVPSTPTDPNYDAGCLTAGTYPSGLIVPVANDVTQYSCRDGDAFISGTLRGRLTVAAEHNVIVTWHLQYASPGTASNENLLGLVANQYVEVFHPVRCTTGGPSSTCNLNIPGRSTPFTNATIQAAVLSVQHSFRVQNYQAGAPIGQLRVTGALAQRYRGPVGTFSGSTIYSGYEKVYVYDTRLKYLSPPHFLDPVKSAWGVVTWAEIPTPAVFP